LKSCPSTVRSSTKQANVPPETVEEQKDSGAKREAAQSRHDAHPERKLLLRFADVDIEAAVEVGELAVQVGVDGGALAVSEGENIGGTQLVEFLAENANTIRSFLGVAPACCSLHREMSFYSKESSRIKPVA
jgi:hypothetical protein